MLIRSVQNISQAELFIHGTRAIIVQIDSGALCVPCVALCILSLLDSSRGPAPQRISSLIIWGFNNNMIKRKRLKFDLNCESYNSNERWVPIDRSIDKNAYDQREPLCYFVQTSSFFLKVEVILFSKILWLYCKNFMICACSNGVMVGRAVSRHMSRVRVPWESF
jgi:hypothetical protein